MALSDDQRAMLQLLLEGGQGYGDIASLLGTTEDQVRARSRAALQELGGTDPDAEVGLTDYLLGQADPIGRADAARHLRNDPATNELATRLAAQLRLLAPKASMPEIPDARPGRGAPPPPTAPTPAQASSAEAPPLRGLAERFGALQGRQRQVVAALAAGAVLLVAVVLAVTGVFGGGDGEEPASEAQPSAEEGLTIVQLEPVGGSSASGQATFARVQDQPVLQLNLNGLQPGGKNQNYIVWLYASDQLAFPIARDQVGENGSLTGATPIPQELVGVLPQFGSVCVSLASNKESRQAIQQAANQQRLPPYTGQSVLCGEIPDAQAAAEELGTATGPGAGGTQTAPAPTAPEPLPQQGAPQQGAQQQVPPQSPQQ
jgi:hypothetical protein